MVKYRKKEVASKREGVSALVSDRESCFPLILEEATDEAIRALLYMPIYIEYIRHS